MAGFSGSDQSETIPYKLSLAKDHPIGEKPTIIQDGSEDFSKFEEALALVKNEKQVLILLDSIYDEVESEAIAAKLPKNSYVEHTQWKEDNEGAAAWVEHHLTRQEEDATNDNFRFLIGDWYTTAGYEAPTVIFVVANLERTNIPTCVQRAKAKLIIYDNM